MSRGSMSLRMQPRVREPNFATAWKGGGIGRAKEDCILPRATSGAQKPMIGTSPGAALGISLAPGYHPWILRS
jgi:hypothetical protein